MKLGAKLYYTTGLVLCGFGVGLLCLELMREFRLSIGDSLIILAFGGSPAHWEAYRSTGIFPVSIPLMVRFAEVWRSS